MRPSSVAVVLSAALASCLVAPGVNADLLKWTGAKGDKKWETPGNWKNMTTNMVPAAAPGAAPNDKHDVVIPSDSGTVIITNDAAPKLVKTFRMEAKAGAAGTKLESAVDPATGRGLTIEIHASGALPIVGNVVPAIRIGEGTSIVVPDSVKKKASTPSGGHIWLEATTRGILVEKDVLIQGGRSADNPDGSGGDVVLLAVEGVDVAGTLKGGWAGAVSGLSRGGAVSVTSKRRSIVIRDTAWLWGGKGAGINGAEAVGDGGSISLEAMLSCTVNGRILAGDAGSSGTAAALADGPGGNVTIQGAEGATAFNVVVSGTAAYVLGGTGGNAGEVRIETRVDIFECTDFGKVAGGKGLDYTKKRGGNVWIEATRKVLNKGTIVGGVGAKGKDGVAAGPGGKVSVKATGLNANIENHKAITGGAAGAGGPDVVAGGDVKIDARRRVDLEATSEVGGGDGNQAQSKPRGDVLVTAANITNVRGGVLRGKKIKATTVVEQDAKSPTSISFQDAFADAVVADELICIDAGPGGTIDLTGIDAGTAVFVCGEGDGAIAMAADFFLFDDGDPDNADDDVQLGDITVPSASESGGGFGCESSCPADLNGDGFIDAADLTLLIGAWGASPDGFADLDLDGDVDGADVALLRAAWGPCV